VRWHWQTLHDWQEIQRKDPFQILEKLMQLKLEKKEKKKKKKKKRRGVI
jgi:hypothetical protein